MADPSLGQDEVFVKLDSLTTELLRKKFKNNFDLCNFSISLARGVILSGQQTSLAEVLGVVDLRAAEYNREHS